LRVVILTPGTADSITRDQAEFGLFTRRSRSTQSTSVRATTPSSVRAARSRKKNAGAR